MMEKLLSYIIPMISIGLTYAFGRLQSEQSDKKSAYKEAYETFYLPYISLLYKSQIWSVGFSRLDFEMRSNLFRLIADNIKYMDKKMIEYVDLLYYQSIIEKELFSISSFVTHERMDEMFDDFTLLALSRSTWLAKKLHQPTLGEFVRELYLEERDIREMQRAAEKKRIDHNEEVAASKIP